MVVWEHLLKGYIVVLDISYLLREDEQERGLASLTVPLERESGRLPLLILSFSLVLQSFQLFPPILSDYRVR